MVPRPLILLVDDDPYFTRTLTDILLLKGFVSECADQGKTAMDKARERPPSAALIDLKLPDMDGLMVMKEIKRHSPGTECIVLTGHASQSSAIEAVNMGAFSYVVKPYDIDQLLVILRRAVEKHQAEEALRESETRYRMLFNNGNDAVVVYPLLENDGAGRFIEVNDVACRELGYEREDLLSFTFSDIEAHAQRNNSPEIISRLFKEKHVLFKPIWYVNTKGSSRWRLILISLFSKVLRLFWPAPAMSRKEKEARKSRMLSPPLDMSWAPFPRPGKPPASYSPLLINY